MAYQREHAILADILAPDVAGLVLEYHQPLTDLAEQLQEIVSMVFGFGILHRLHIYTFQQYYQAELTDGGIRFFAWETPEYFPSGIALKDFWPPFAQRRKPVGSCTVFCRRPRKLSQVIVDERREQLLVLME